MIGKGTLFMPELPEVEVLRRDLLKKLPKPALIARIRLLAPMLRTPLKLPRWVSDGEIEILEIQRRSKYLILKTHAGILLSHLGMSGQWRVAGRHEVKKHDHVVIEWKNGDFWIYNDARRFGIFEYHTHQDLLKNKVKWLNGLGPEPFDDNFFADETINKIRGSARPIKSIIMDAKVMVGVGNIYASEALFKARINPFKLGAKVSAKKVAALLVVIRQTLKEAIKGGGSSIRDYVHSDGAKGDFQKQHLVYGRDGELCVECGSKIRIKKIQGRSTFWCVKCQS